MLHSKKVVPETVAFGVFYETLLALNYLHKSYVMHRDIKLENVIYDENTKRLKLLDFGSALKFADCGPRQRRLTGTVTPFALRSTISHPTCSTSSTTGGATFGHWE